MSSKLLIIVLSITCYVMCNGSSASCEGSYREELRGYSDFMADLWNEGGDMLKILLRDCSKKVMKTSSSAEIPWEKFTACMKRKSLKALDRSLNADEIPLTNGVDLVRYEMLDREGRVVKTNANSSSGLWSDSELEEGDWKVMALERMARLLKTHVFKVDLDPNTPGRAEFRHRRRHHMMTMMMFGIVSMGLVLVPMGFQFLAVLGGKALLLSKMALLLSSIQGLKKVQDWHSLIGLQSEKVATSPLSYGFYNYPTPYEHIEGRSQYSENRRSDPYWNVKPRSKRTQERTRSKRVHKKMLKSPSQKEERLYPVYAQTLERAYPVYHTAQDTVSQVLQNLPSEVHAEYTIELPQNNFRFQSPPDVISS